MISTYRKIWELLSADERRSALFVLAMILVMGFLQMVGVASIMPFMAVLANPDVVQTNRYLATAYEILGFSDVDTFLYFLGVTVFILLMVSIIFKGFTTYTLVRFTEMRNYSLSRNLMAAYLGQPYEWFLSRHSADLGTAILSQAEYVIRGALAPAMQMIAQGTLVLSLIALLIFTDPILALVVALGFGGIYALIYIAMRGHLHRIGTDLEHANHQRFGAAQDTFGSIKDVKVGGLEGRFLQRFDGPARRLARHKAAQAVAAEMPRYAMEALAFGGLLLIVLYLMARPGGLQEAFPVLVMFAFAAFRIAPAIQSFFSQLVYLRFHGASLDALHQEFEMLPYPAGAHLPLERASPLGIAERLRLVRVTYNYPGNTQPAIDDIDLTIPVNSTVGIVGMTGSGKTTLVDVILGLLSPQRGQVIVDETPITPDQLRAWQSTIGYVPQNIFLADASVLANIAFGIPAEQVDQAAVERAARIANLHDFITGEMPNGYATLIGENGVRLSGGQRQRISIARALYHDPDLLILDEATSALDNLTEQVVMEAVHNLGNKKTVILIAHRLTTVRECDQIFLLEHGRIESHGTFSELKENNERFRNMAGDLS